MSSKRRADKYLTDQNWDQEEEKEEKGKFETASLDVLKGRTFKKALRRVAPQEGSASAFKGFGGLTSITSSASDSNGLKGFKLPASSPKSTPDFLVQTAEPMPGDSATTKMDLPKEKMTFGEPKHDLSGTDVSSQSDLSSEYVRHITALNKNVSQWISEHVAKNPVCDLTPIFSDYDKHLSDIEEKYGGQSSQSDTSQSSGKMEETSDSEVEKPVSPKTSKKDAPPKAIRAKTPPKNPLGSTFTPSTLSSSPFKGFGTIGSKPPTGGIFKSFQFSSTMVSSVPSVAPSAASTSQNPPGEEEYVPPQPEHSTVQEKDSFFTKKCKLFYMKDGTYADKGVGHLHLKPAPNNKTQLIVRADTPLGNLLLNIMLNPAMPVNKQGKNNISFSCVTNPPIDEKDPEKVFPMLLRVKASEDADELLDMLEKKKKESE